MGKWRPTCERCGRRYTPKAGVSATVGIGCQTMESKRSYRQHKICDQCYHDFIAWFGDSRIAAGMGMLLDVARGKEMEE